MRSASSSATYGAQSSRFSDGGQPNVRAIYAAVSASLILILIFIWVLALLISPSTLAVPISIVIGLALVPNVAVAVWPGRVPLGILVASFVANVLATAAGVHFGGGADQVSAPLLYTVLIGLSGLLISGRAAFLAAAGSALTYGVVVWMEYAGWLAHRVDYQRPPDRQAATVVMVTLYLLLFAWLVSYVVRQVRASYKRAEDLRGEAVSALSHDLKSPLGIISGYAQMLEEATPAQRAEYVRRIDHATQQALDLVSNVLDAAAESRPMLAQRVPVQINDVIRQVVDPYGFGANGKGVHLSVELADHLPLIQADPQLLSRALGNLVSNAIKYTQRDGHVRVVTAGGDGVITIAVDDDGCGIAPEDQARLFEKYSRVGSGRRVEGTGLGLYIVRRIAEAHGGSVSVSSAVGKGSVFTVRLPIGDVGKRGAGRGWARRV